MIAHRNALALATATLVVSACVPAVNLATPAPIASTDWSVTTVPDAAPPQAALAALVASPELEVLTDRAFAQNSDIRIAEAQVSQAQALLRGARLAVLPEISLSAGASRERAYGTGLPDFRDAFASIDVDLDLDLFGRLGSQTRAARARYRAAELARDAIALAVETDVAAAYIQRAAIERRISLLDANIDRAEELERIIRVRYEAGAATRVDLGLQTIHTLNLRTERSRLEESLDQTRTALALLAGEEAPLFQFAPGRLQDLVIPQFAPPSPAELLAQRPDIRAAEALIEAADGDVGAARAAFFPQVGISLSGLLTDTSTGPLGKAVTLGSSLLAPIFSRGQLSSELAYASAAQVEAVETYRKTILVALAETEDALSAIDHSGRRAELLEQVVDEAQQTARLANLQYIEGEEDLQSLLDAQQFLTDAEEAKALATQEQFFARIALYRAMGGFQGQPLAATPRLAY